VLDDGANSGSSLNKLLYLLKERDAQVVAALVIEDKLDDAARFALQSTWGSAGEDRQGTRLLFLHRSPHVQPDPIEGRCDACGLLWAVGVLQYRPGQRLPFIREAYAHILEAPVWPPEGEEISKRQKSLMEIDQTYPASTQLNRLLQHHEDELKRRKKMPDAIVRDMLPQLRAQGLAETIQDLHEFWVERVFLWIDPEDQVRIGQEISGSPSAVLSRLLGLLRTAQRASHFEELLRRLALSLDEEPELALARYADVTEHILRVVMHQRNRLAWLQAAIAATSDASCEAIKALHGELLALSTQLPFQPQRPAGKLQAFVLPGEVLLDNPSAETVSSYDRNEGWKLDCADGYSVVVGGVTHPLEPLTAFTIALAVVKGRLFTSEATRIYKEAMRIQPTKGKHRFETICGRAEQLPLSTLVQSGMQSRNTAGRREEHCLQAVSGVGVVVWRDDGTAPWMQLTSLARRLPALTP
jgi:hypothetical protein